MSTTVKSKLTKWLYALLAAVLAIFGMLAVSCKKDKPIADGPEVGVYYYDAETEDYVITLLSQRKFAFLVGEDSKLGQYKIDGDTLTFMFDGEKGEGATAVLKEDVMTVTYQESTMRFLKKIPYTVTFEANGGNDVAAQTVINGKKVTKPDDPAKENNVFLGWYANTELTVPYNFDADMVTANTTIYAKWAEKTEGEATYTVDFDLGYDAQAPAATTTIGGKIYNVTTPKREGYTFNGWWISIYEDGEKLSYAYTEDTVFTANTTLFASWVSNETTSKLAAPQVSVNANGASWAAVAGVSTYQITVVDAATNKEILKDSQGGTTYVIPFAELAAGDYIVSVTAKASVEANDSETTVRYYKNKGLNRVSSFTVIDPSTLLFNAVEGATGYYVTVVCGNEEHNHTNFYNGNSTNFNFSNCTMTEEGIRFVVTATAKGYASSVSETFVYKRALSAVTGLKVDEDSQLVRWNAVENATNYIVTITDANGEYVIDNGGALSCNLEKYAAGANGITVSVLPVTSGYVSPAAATVTFNKTQLATPVIIGVDNTTLTWTEVAGATGYVVKIGNQEYTADTNSYDFADVLTFTENEYTFSVKAVSDAASSTYSASITAYYNTLGEEISYSGNVVTWDPVIGATFYMVQVNDEYARRVDGSECSLEVVLGKAGTNTITVTTDAAVGSVSIDVYAYTIELDSRAGSAVKPVYVATGDKINIAVPTRTGYEFVAWYTTLGGPASNGAAYTEQTFNGIGDMVLFAHWAPKAYNVTFSGSGVDFDEIVDTRIKYNADYTLPVPVSSDKSKMFAGWYTGVNGTQIQLTDANGISVAPFGFVTDQTVYAYWAADVFRFKLNEDGKSYSVAAGTNIDAIAKAYVPTEHEDLPVTVVEAQGFAYSYYLREISIPNTVTLIGAGAFTGCSRLQDIEIYEVEGTHEVFYTSYDGGVVYKDVASGGVMTLAFFPRAKTGSYTLPSEVTRIESKVFQQAKISEVIIPASVEYIASYAFASMANLETVRFAFEGKTAGTLTMEENIFTGSTKIKKFYVPAQAGEVDLKIFKTMPVLEYIEVEEGNIAYTSVDGMLCNADDANKTILFAPRGMSGIVEIPAGIYNVGEGAFQNNTGILQLIIPNFINEIGANAFSGSSALINVIFKGTRYMPLTIGENAFANMAKLKSVDFEANASGQLDVGTVEIGTYAFANNSKLTNLTVGEGVNIAKVGSYAFYNDTRLGTIDVADGAAMTEIGTYAFANLTYLREIVIHASTTTIGDYAYSGCSYVTEVSFQGGENQVAFGGYVFNECSRLATINLPANVTAFDGSAFAGCDGINTITVDPANEYLTAENGILYDKAKTTLMYYPKASEIDFADTSVVPATLTTIGAAVFQNNQKIVNVIIPASVTKIGADAFNNCINLESVTFAKADAEIEIGAGAFANCGKLTAITLPTNVKTIEERTFSHTPIAAITIPEGVTSIGAKAFEFTYIESIAIPASVTAISNAAFANCAKLTAVTFADGDAPLALGTANLNEYNSGATNAAIFAGSNAIAAIALPARLTVVGDYAFANSKAAITFAENSKITKIGTGAFINDAKVQAALPNFAELTVIGEYAFYGTKIASIEIANTVTEIKTYAFANTSTSLESVTFAEGNDEVGLTIDDYAFANAKLTTITLPARTAMVGSTDETFYTVFYSQGVNASHKGENTQYSSSTKYDPIFKAVNFAGENTFYSSDDGVVYRKDGKGNDSILLYVPRAKTGEYTVKLGTTLVVNRAINGTSLTKLIFADYEKGDANYGKPLLTIGTLTDYDNLNGYWGVTTIGNSKTLEEIHFPSTLTTINMFAVAYMQKLSQLTFKEDGASLWLEQWAITYLGLRSENYNPPYGYIVPDNSAVIEEVKLPKLAGIGSGGRGIYQTNIKNLVFHKDSTIENVPYYGFAYNLFEKLEFPASIEYFDTFSVQNNRALKEVTFAEGSKCTSIGGYAFAGSKALTKFEMPENLTTLGGSNFNEAFSLESVTLSAKLGNMFDLDGNSIFGYSDTAKYAIKEVIVPEASATMKSIDGVVFSKDGSEVLFYPYRKPAKDLTTNAELVEAMKNVKAIGNYAFNTYQGVIELPENIEYIGERAFYGNLALTSIHIGKYVKEIGEAAFSGCTNVTSVTFEEGSILETIGASAFSGLKVSEFIMPDTVTYLGMYFLGSSNTEIKKVHLSNSLEEIPDWTFISHENLSEVNIPESALRIGWWAFNGTAITSVTIPANVRVIEEEAFKGCKKLEKVTFEDGSLLNTLGINIFMNDVKLKEIVLPDGLTSMDADNDGGMFMNCTGLERVVLPEGLETLPVYIFKGCTSLTTVEMPSTLKTIKADTFTGLTKLESIVIPASVETIEGNAFEGCTALKSVTFEEGSVIESLGTAGTQTPIFRGTTALGEIVLPDSIIEMGDNIFENSGIKSVRLPANLEAISNSAFKGCVNLESFEIPATVISIGDSAFAGCTSITAITVPSGTEIVGNDAFEGCTNLATVSLSDTVMQLNGNPFRNCVNLVNFTENTDSLKMIDGVLYDADAYTIIYAPVSTAGDVVMLDTVREVAPGAFAGTKITSVIISDYVEEIPAATFSDCTELKSVTISANVKVIGDRAFNGCTKLESLYLPKSVIEVGEAAFKGCAALATLAFEARNTEITFGASTFENCTLITEFVFPDGVTAFADYMFAGTSIVDLVIPECVEDVSAMGVFMNCESLKTVTFEGEVYGAIGYRFFMNTAIEEIELPAGISELGTYFGKPDYVTKGEVFRDCKQLTSVTFAEGSELYSIGSHNFAGCEKLTSIEIPSDSGDIWLDDYAFAGSYFEELTLPAMYETYSPFGYYEGEDTPITEYAPYLKKVTFYDIGCIYETNFEGMPLLEEIIFDGVYDIWASDWYMGGNLTESTTITINCYGEMEWDYFFDDPEDLSSGFIDMSGGVKVILDGVSYDDWLAEQ